MQFVNNYSVKKKNNNNNNLITSPKMSIYAYNTCADSVKNYQPVKTTNPN